MLKKALEKHSYGVDWMQVGESGLAALEDLTYGVVILDLNLPKLSGIEVVRSTPRRKNMVPILLLSAMGMQLQKVKGLDSGADDYLVKPFDLDELLARLRALARRRASGNRPEIWKPRNRSAAMVVRSASAQVAMTAKEFQMLKLLMERAGKYVTKSDIEYALYSAESAIESNATEVVIYNRKKLGSDFIKSTGAWDICLVNTDKAPLEISSREHFITASIS